MAPILSHGQTTSGQCAFNQVASPPADPMKRHRARRERSHPKAMLNTQTSAVALDLLENGIGAERTGRHGALPAAIWGIPESSRGGSRWPRTIRIRQDASVTTAEPAIAVARDQVIDRVGRVLP
jgi:hypothetical protein